MIRIFHVYFASRTVLLALSELLLLILASLPASLLVLGADAGTMFFDGGAILKLMLVVAVCMALMHYFDLYESMILFRPAQAAVRVLQVLGISCVILAAIYHLYPGIEIDPNLMVLWIILAGVSLIVWRRMFLVLNQSARMAQRIILWGGGPLALHLAEEIQSRPELGLEISAYVSAEEITEASFAQLEHWNTGGDLEPRIVSERIHRVIVAGGGPPMELVEAVKQRGVIFDDGREFYEAVAGRVDLSTLQPSALASYEGFRSRPLIALYKRSASIVLSFTGLLLLLPVMAAIAIAIRMESAGPVIFRQKRVGKTGKAFTLYKFRSMRDGSDKNSPFKPTERNDSRFTRVGKWLRRTRLDEIPQLYNILRGDMHFIGPRPFALDEEERLSEAIPYYANRWAVRPGATGWAQVRKGYNETLADNVEKLMYDLYYIKHLSVGLDLLILLETVKILLLGRGAR